MAVMVVARSWSVFASLFARRDREGESCSWYHRFSGHNQEVIHTRSQGQQAEHRLHTQLHLSWEGP